MTYTTYGHDQITGADATPTNTQIAIMISKATSGSVGSEVPGTGTSDWIIFLVAKGISGSDKFMQKIKALSGGSSYSMKDGKVEPSAVVSDVYIVKYTGGANPSTNTAAFNYIRQKFRSIHRSGQSPVYLWVKNLTDNVYVQLSQNTSGAATNYMKGYCDAIGWELKQGNMYYFKQLNFKESLT